MYVNRYLNKNQNIFAIYSYLLFNSALKALMKKYLLDEKFKFLKVIFQQIR